MTDEDDDTAKRRTQFFNTLLFETPGGERFTQDSPILTNVWLAFARQPREPVDLILTVRRDASTGKAARQLRERVERLRADGAGRASPCDKRSMRVAYLPGQIAIRLYFDELIHVVLPLTPWWGRSLGSLDRAGDRYTRSGGSSTRGDGSSPSMPDWENFPAENHEHVRHWLVEGLMLMRRGIGGSVTSGDADTDRAASFVRDMPVDFLWLVRIAGIIADLARDTDGPVSDAPSNGTPGDTPGAVPGITNDVTRSFDLDFRNRRFKGEDTVDLQSGTVVQSGEDARDARKRVVDAFLDLYRTRGRDSAPATDKPYIWRVTKNRTAELAVAESTLTVKADAARRLFDISCRDITWAIVDSGIDSTHPAFRDNGADAEAKAKAKADAKAGAVDPRHDEPWPNRVVRTYDFTNLRDLLDPDLAPVRAPVAGKAGKRAKKPTPTPREKEAATRREALIESLVARRETAGATAPGGKKGPARRKALRADVLDDLEALHRRILKGHDIDWETLEPLITDRAPSTPSNDHGTHVAGILAADWVDDANELKSLPLAQRPRRMQGTCPEIKLIDCRVFREEGDTDEFEILAAIQFLRWLNSRAGYTFVHGANLSLSLLHEVRRFACGQTPICIECNEAAALGVVIVAAAGNRGYDSDDLELTGRTKGYKAINITDPGNADGVITVGATHRKRPHEYGVSYFSSRGPTGDGRLKPDLVAPGEKIKGPTPGARSEYKDGTSMAAPHVSGAAAMLMSRHKELCGNPARIKEILCSTATDLGRDRYFQGHGLVDVLRALQSL